MKLCSDHIEVAYNCVAAVMRGFTTAQPPWAVQHPYDELNREVRAMSHTGHESGCGREESEPERLLSSRQVASMLGCTKRHVNRRAEALGAVNIDGTNVFRESEILEHLEGRDD
jgi:hypothetical protein